MHQLKPNNLQLSEHQIQAQIVAYFNTTFPTLRKCLFHVNNKAKNSIEGAKFKALGTVAGVSDLILVATNQTIYIELKDDKGKQQPDQMEFQRQINSLGSQYHIIRSLSEFKALLSQLHPYNQIMP
jgi:hypothetical protein